MKTQKKTEPLLRSRFLWKLYAGFSALILLATGIVGYLTSRHIEIDTLVETDRRLRSEAVLLRDAVSRDLSYARSAELQLRVQALGQQIGTRLTVVAASGKVLADSEEEPSRMDNHGDRIEIVTAHEQGVGSATRYSSTLEQTMRYLALPLELDGQVVGAVRTSLPLTALDERLAHLRRAVLAGAGIAIFVALALGFLLARRITRPLLLMTAAAEEIAAGAYAGGGGSGIGSSGGGELPSAVRIEIHRRDELGALARAFNQMSRALRDSIAGIGAESTKLSAILASMVEGVVAVDRDERVLHMNQVAGRFLEVDPEAVVSHPIWEVTRIRGISEALSQAMAEGSLVEKEVHLPGSPDLFLQLRASPLVTGGQIAGAVLVFDDVTQIRRLETMRRDFFGNVSHELKTPVTVIRGMVETLIDDPAAPPSIRARFLGRVLVQAERLTTLISDLLSLSRLESGASVLEAAPIDLRHPVNASIRQLQPVAESHDVRISPQLPPTALMVAGEDEGLRQAVTNLLHNAIKFSPASGEVAVRISSQDGRAVIEVEDHGLGIEPKHQQRLFERFYRIDKARSRELGGTGLGLAIVKHIALALGGEVTVDSQLGRGSIFRIYLPLAEPGD